MERTLAVVLTALALVLGAPSAQATTDGWCLVPGSDICRRYVAPTPDGWCQDSADSCRSATPPATEGWCSDSTAQGFSPCT
jgi:hypothetical protein